MQLECLEVPSSVEVNLKTTRWPKTKIHFPNTGTLGRHGEPLASSSLDATSVCRSTRNGSGKRPSSRCADRPKSSQASTSVIRHSDAVVAQRGRNVSFEAKMLWLDLGSTHTEQRAGKELPADKATEESNRAVERDTAPTSSTRESTAICSCLKAERTSRHRPPTRKNCWGGSSYTELITTAIESSPQRRLSLAQIYEWIVKNVPYFKDKERYLSVQGWKNTVRHTLSIRKRFVRIKDPRRPYRSMWTVGHEQGSRRSTQNATSRHKSHPAAAATTTT